jgi:DNA-binding IclR family transcriptional regulator
MRAPSELATSQEVRDVNSLSRGLELLRVFRPFESALSVGEMSLRLGIPRATIQRLADTLVGHGFLRRILDSDRYQPDGACLVVGDAMLHSCSVARIARPILQELAFRHGVTVVLAVRERLRMLCLDCIAAPDRPLIPAVDVGMLLPLAATSVGRAWLWAQAGALQGELIQSLRVEGGDQGAKEIAGIYHAFQEMETQGYCLSAGSWLPDISSVGTAITVDNGACFGLSCKLTGPGSRKELLRGKIAASLLQAAGRIKVEEARSAA